MKEAGFLPNVSLNVNIAAPVMESQQEAAEPAEMMEEEEEKWDSDSAVEEEANSSEEEFDEQDGIVSVVGQQDEKEALNMHIGWHGPRCD